MRGRPSTRGEANLSSHIGASVRRLLLAESVTGSRPRRLRATLHRGGVCLRCRFHRCDDLKPRSATGPRHLPGRAGPKHKPVPLAESDERSGQGYAHALELKRFHYEEAPHWLKLFLRGLTQADAPLPCPNSRAARHAYSFTLHKPARVRADNSCEASAVWNPAVVQAGLDQLSGPPLESLSPAQTQDDKVSSVWMRTGGTATKRATTHN